MKSIMRRCECGRYTMKEGCPDCGKATLVLIPPRYSPEDKFAEYRRRSLAERREGC